MIFSMDSQKNGSPLKHSTNFKITLLKMNFSAKNVISKLKNQWVWAASSEGLDADNHTRLFWEFRLLILNYYRNKIGGKK